MASETTKYIQVLKSGVNWRVPVVTSLSLLKDDTTTDSIPTTNDEVQLLKDDTTTDVIPVLTSVFELANKIKWTFKKAKEKWTFKKAKYTWK